ncbi:MAG: ATP-binding protein [Gammaproteobacteria bacterium]|jgi:tRNA 2-thiocytidine biosynthesis protein TtcA
MTGFLKPPKSLLRKVGKAIADYAMIRDGDRLLLGVSGGKDSLTLLHILGHLQTYAPVQFELGVITVDPEVDGFDPHTLTGYYDDIGVRWHYEEQPIMEQAKEHMDGDSFCAYCSRMKRGIMYSTCRREGYNVLALAQHLDDLAESLLMSIFHGGQLRTMKAHYVNKDGDIRIIRPLAYVRETMTAAFAEEANLPVIPDSCPACFSMPTRREQTKQLLRQLEKENKNLFANMLHAMRPLLTEDFDSPEGPGGGS